MLHAGLDLSRKRIDVCLLSDEGEVVSEFAAPTPATRPCQRARSLGRWRTTQERSNPTTGGSWMPSSDDFDRAIEQSHFALSEIVKGNVEPFMALYSDRDDVTLGNPFGTFVRGKQQVAETGAVAAARYREGEIVGFDRVANHVTDDLACIAEVERFRAKVGGSDDVATIALRVTSVFRREDDGWRLVHRHADPITTPQPAESVIQK
jgi:ketosteroid isomerase-like protein